MARRPENGTKPDLPDSDQSARQKQAQEQEEENWNEVTDVITDKVSVSRPESGDERPAQAATQKRKA